MSGMSPVHWIIVLSVLAVQAVPVVRILQRTGHSGWWTIAYFIPVIGWLSVWIFAFSPWPAVGPAARVPSADERGVGV